MGTSGQLTTVVPSALPVPGVNVHAAPPSIVALPATTPTGRMSVTTGPVDTDGPALLTMIFQVAGLPAVRVTGTAVFVSERLAEVKMSLVEAPELLVRSGSGVAEATTAVFVTVGPAKPAARLPVTVTTASAPAASVPRSQCTAVAVCVQVPAALLAPVKVTPGGAWSSTVT